MNKKEARDILVTLVYEHEFNPEKTASDIYDSALEERGFENFRYIKKGLFDISEKREYIGGIIDSYSNGWKFSRIAPVTRAVLLVAVYDMVFKSTPCGVAINEAIELTKKYDASDATSFINGILNSIAQNLDDIKSLNEETVASDET